MPAATAPVASDLGAYSFGFDVRDHWIEQARFLKRHFGKSDDQVRFEVCDLLEVDRRLGSERFDICLFKGIFYHLPDPIAGLKIVADRTDEVLILDTASTSGLEDGFLSLVSRASSTNPMSGTARVASHRPGSACSDPRMARLRGDTHRVLAAASTVREVPRTNPHRRREGRHIARGPRNASCALGACSP